MIFSQLDPAAERRVESIPLSSAFSLAAAGSSTLSPAATLDIDYLVEIRGAEAERCRLHLEIRA